MQVNAFKIKTKKKQNIFFKGIKKPLIPPFKSQKKEKKEIKE